MPTKIKVTFSPFWKNCSGSVAIEFAMLLPFFIAVILAIVLQWYNALTVSLLDNATYEAAHQLRIANSTVNNAEDYRDSVLCPLLPSIITCTDIEIGVISTDDFSTLEDWHTTDRDSVLNQFCTGAAGDIIWVYVRLNLNSGMRWIHHYITQNTHDDAIFQESSAVVVREPIVTGTGLTC
ncbi:TadE/TadG family type IV pilus assembly protein [Parvularcula sp. IMCC14364]|uniref:TadE/TadG family type IV pilus assembly protein n=1 Tax=Parvularcula sp. IMCC14364 TaxID=3067902 RepID=UPI0027403CF2|nr:TadE/TadG family type IV pilus assembly protein [Parvularcula sp. IMCC14364]